MDLWIEAIYYTPKSPMAYCINCGAQNRPDAVFCLSCGQPLFRERRQASMRHRMRIATAVCFGALICALIVILSLKRPENKNISIPEVSHGTSAQTTGSAAVDAVLTIVSYNSRGSALEQGSGFILTPDGLAGTNYHVLQGATEAVAKCCNGRVFRIGTVEGIDLDKDLVIFQLNDRDTGTMPHDLPTITLGSSSSMSVGQKVVVIGSPRGLENTVSDGILSAIREYDSVRYLQITAPISPGSSGGPVLNENGQMIGIATMQLEKGQNLNFAVAAEQAKPLLDQHLGIALSEFPSALRLAQREQTRGTITGVDKATLPAQTAGYAPMTGVFTGEVHNLTANESAKFSILVRDSDGNLSGCMGVFHPLAGSGPLEGSADSADVHFDVTSDIGTITFTGTRSDNSITGTYTVQQVTGGSEEGTFSLTKLNRKGPDMGSDGSIDCPNDAELN